METNLFFWLGELGLILSVIFGYGMIEITKPRPLYYTVPVWLFMVSAAFVALTPLAAPGAVQLPEAVYLYALGGGTVMTGAFAFYRYGGGAEVDASEVRFFNRFLIIAALVGLLVAALVGMRLALYRANTVQAESNKLERIRQKLDAEAIKADTTTNIEIKNALDSNAKALEETRLELEHAKARLRRIEVKTAVKPAADTVKTKTNTDAKPKKKKFRLWPFGRAVKRDSVAVYADSLYAAHE